MKKSIFTGVLFSCLLFVAGHGYCGDPEKEEHVFAIQERIFHKYHELTFVSGYIPDDNFYHSFPIGVGYTFNFNDYISWEVARAYIALNNEKDLKTDLEAEFGATPSQFMEPKHALLTHFVIRPFYGKDALWNKRILNHETYFFAGGGVNRYEKRFSFGESDIRDFMCLSFGAGLKYFINKNLNVAVEIRDLVTFKEEKTENNVWIGINFGFRFNLSSRKNNKDRTIEELNKYIK